MGSNGVTPLLVSYPKVILLGDSLTQRCMSADSAWGALIADFLARRCDVIVRGFSGYNSRKVLPLLPHLFEGLNFSNTVAAVLICLGANDNSEPGTESHVPMDEFAENMLSIGNFFMEKGLSASKIIMTGPPAFYGPAWEERCKELGMVVGKKTNAGAADYSLLVTEVSKHLGCRNIPLHSKMMQEQNWNKMLIDGLHFGPQGAQFYFELLKPHLEHLTYDIPTMLPLWRDYGPPNSKNSKPLSETVQEWICRNPYFVQ